MDVERFWTLVATGDGCWEWRGTRQSKGYGVFWDGERQVRAHRTAWELVNGPIPAGLSVLHSCDNPPCVNPAHLRVGTARDNASDAMARRRHFSPFRGQNQAGEQNRNARLTAADVTVIRERVASGELQRNVAADYGITQSNVSHIARGKSWR